jgi:putative peptidoglycan lipid II flippase
MSKSIALASIIWGGAILLSRFIGLIREATIGRVLGVGINADVYLTSFVIPDFLNSLLAGGALSIVFIPIFGSYLTLNRTDEAWKAFRAIALSILIFCLISGTLLWAYMPELVLLVAPGFSPSQSSKLVYLTRIILPAQLFHLVGGLLSAVLQSYDRHTIPALAPLIYTLGIILGGLVGQDAEGFSWGVLVGSFVGPFMLPLIGCRKLGLTLWIDKDFYKNPDLKIYFTRSLPIMLGWSIVILDDWFLRRFGSYLGNGSVATIQYAKNIMRVPMGVFGLASGVAIYPTLTRLIGNKDIEGAYIIITKVIKRMLVLAFAAQVVLTTSSIEIITLVYGKHLNSNQYTSIGVALNFISCGLWAWTTQSVVSRGFWVLGRNWLPTFIGTIIAVISYPIYSILSIHYGTSGLAVASSISISIYTTIMILVLRRVMPEGKDYYLSYFLKIIPTVGLAIFVNSVAISFTLNSMISLSIFFLIGYLLKVKEIHEVLNTIFSRIFAVKNLDRG